MQFAVVVRFELTFCICKGWIRGYDRRKQIHVLTYTTQQPTIIKKRQGLIIVDKCSQQSILCKRTGKA